MIYFCPVEDGSPIYLEGKDDGLILKLFEIGA